jgi:hypothetical protein
MDHNHDNNERRTEMQQLSVSVKRKAGDDLTSRPSKLIRSELHKLDGHLLHSEDIRSVAQSPWISFGCKLKFLSVQAVFKEFHIFLCQNNQRCLERAKETELTIPLHNLARIVPARLPDWIILNLWGTVSLPGQICK